MMAKYGFIRISKNDSTFELPDQFNKNVDIIIQELDRIQERIGQLEHEIKRVKEEREWP